MRIALVCLGLEEYGAQLASALYLHGHEILAMIGEAGARELALIAPSYCCRDGLRMVAIAGRRGLDLRRLIAVTKGLLAMLQFKPQLLHIVYGCDYPETALIARTAQVMGIPLVCTLHDAQVHPGDSLSHRARQKHLRILAMSTRVIVHGSTIAQDAQRNLGFAPEKLVVVPLGNFSIFRQCRPALPAARAASDPVVLMFGRMKQYKGLEVLLAAAPLIADKIPRVRIVLAGAGPEIVRLRTKAAALPGVEIHDRHLSWQEIARFFEEAWVVVLPYIEASQSGPLSIAFSFAKPVVASKVGSLAEVVRHGENGLLVEPGKPAELADSLVTILQDANLRARLSANAALTAEQELSWERRIAPLTAHVYSQAVAQEAHQTCQFVSLKKKTSQPAPAPHVEADTQVFESHTSA